MNNTCFAGDSLAGGEALEIDKCNSKATSASTDSLGFTPISSISDAEARLISWDARTKSNLPEFILDSIEEDSKNFENRTIFGSADEYHNLASEFARKELYRAAAFVASQGAALYKYNVDLLADIIKFGAKSQAWNDCKKALERLEQIPRGRWGWRAYTFVIDYLFDLIEISDPKEYPAIEKVILNYINEYKKLKDERAWVAEAELYSKKGDSKKAIAVLESGVKSVRIVPQICVMLSDLLLKQGRYEDVVKYAAIGLRSTAQEQPSANIGYLVYVSALANDAMIHEESYTTNNAQGKGFNDIERVNSTLAEYELAAALIRNRTLYSENISKRIKILRCKGLLDENTSSENEEHAIRDFLSQIKLQAEKADTTSLTHLLANEQHD